MATKTESKPATKDSKGSKGSIEEPFEVFTFDFLVATLETSPHHISSLLAKARLPPYSLSPTQMIRMCLKISDKCKGVILKRMLNAVIEKEFQKIEKYQKSEA